MPISSRTGWWNKDSVEFHIANRIPFKTYGALFGKWIRKGDFRPIGILPDSHARRFRVDCDNESVFVIYSYDTPIGWITESGNTYIPDERYSVTTSKHQGKVRLGIAVFNNSTPRPAHWDEV